MTPFFGSLGSQSRIHCLSWNFVRSVFEHPVSNMPVLLYRSKISIMLLAFRTWWHVHSILISEKRGGNRGGDEHQNRYEELWSSSHDGRPGVQSAVRSMAGCCQWLVSLRRSRLWQEWRRLGKHYFCCSCACWRDDYDWKKGNNELSPVTIGIVDWNFEWKNVSQSKTMYAQQRSGRSVDYLVWVCLVSTGGEADDEQISRVFVEGRGRWR